MAGNGDLGTGPDFSRDPRQPSVSVGLQVFEGFARFLKEHTSPRSKRVTAGGRVVSAGPNTPPPTFHTEFIDRLLQDVEQSKSKTFGASPGGFDGTCPSQRNGNPSDPSAHQAQQQDYFNVANTDHAGREPHILNIPSNWEVVKVNDNGQSALVVSGGTMFRAHLAPDGQTSFTLPPPEYVCNSLEPVQQLMLTVPKRGLPSKYTPMQPGVHFRSGPAVYLTPRQTVGNVHASTQPGTFATNRAFASEVSIESSNTVSQGPALQGSRNVTESAACPWNSTSQSGRLSHAHHESPAQRSMGFASNGVVPQPSHFGLNAAYSQVQTGSQSAAPQTLHADMNAPVTGPLQYEYPQCELYDKTRKFERTSEQIADVDRFLSLHGHKISKDEFHKAVDRKGYLIVYRDQLRKDKEAIEQALCLSQRATTSLAGNSNGVVNNGIAYLESPGPRPALGRGYADSTGPVYASFESMLAPEHAARVQTAFSGGNCRHMAEEPTSAAPLAKKELSPTAPVFVPSGQRKVTALPKGWLHSVRSGIDDLRATEKYDWSVSPHQLRVAIANAYAGINGHRASDTAFETFKTRPIREVCEAAVTRSKGGVAPLPEEVDKYVESQFKELFDYLPSEIERTAFEKWLFCDYMEFSMEWCMRKYIRLRKVGEANWEPWWDMVSNTGESVYDRLQRHLREQWSPPSQPFRTLHDEHAYMSEVIAKRERAHETVESILANSTLNSTNNSAAPTGPTHSNQIESRTLAAAPTNGTNLVRPTIVEEQNAASMASTPGTARRHRSAADPIQNGAENKRTSAAPPSAAIASRLALKSSSAIASASTYQAAGIFDGANADTAGRGGAAVSLRGGLSGALAAVAEAYRPFNPTTPATYLRGGFSDRQRQADEEGLLNGVNVPPHAMHEGYGCIIYGVPSLHGIPEGLTLPPIAPAPSAPHAQQEQQTATASSHAFNDVGSTSNPPHMEEEPQSAIMAPRALPTHTQGYGAQDAHSLTMPLLCAPHVELPAASSPPSADLDFSPVYIPSRVKEEPQTAIIQPRARRTRKQGNSAQGNSAQDARSTAMPPPEIQPTQKGPRTTMVPPHAASTQKSSYCAQDARSTTVPATCAPSQQEEPQTITAFRGTQPVQKEGYSAQDARSNYWWLDPDCRVDRKGHIVKKIHLPGDGPPPRSLAPRPSQFVDPPPLPRLASEDAPTPAASAPVTGWHDSSHRVDIKGQIVERSAYQSTASSSAPCPSHMTQQPLLPTLASQTTSASENIEASGNLAPSDGCRAFSRRVDTEARVAKEADRQAVALSNGPTPRPFTLPSFHAAYQVSHNTAASETPRAPVGRALGIGAQAGVDVPVGATIYGSNRHSAGQYARASAPATPPR